MIVWAMYISNADQTWVGDLYETREAAEDDMRKKYELTTVNYLSDRTEAVGRRDEEFWDYIEIREQEVKK